MPDSIIQQMERISTSLERHPDKEDSLSWACLAKELGRKVGFDFPSSESIVGKMSEEVEEISEALALGDKENLLEEIGDLLLAAVSLACHEGLNPSEALRASVEKFLERIRAVEESIIAEGKVWKDYPPEELEEFWKKSKNRKP